ncbi:MBL fold metallo-hydrolase [Litorimonas sp.]|uniref:MBL fold metallo-hydrolase n=1 Tax=Litorimonas sp. TaxID=1892381 RepID=UPI003A8B4F13
MKPMARLDLKLLPVTPFAQNCSLLYDVETKEGVLIDPGGEPEKLKTAMEEIGITLKEIWLTHGHLDHAGGAQTLREDFGIEVIGPHKDDQFWMDDIEQHWARYGHAGMGRNVVPDRYLNDGDELELSGVTFKVAHTPGHTPGHVVIYNQDMKIAFVGDVLFRGSIGRTDFPKGNHAQLIKSITTKLWPLGSDMRFVPGHGPMGTFGAERADNPYVADDVVKHSTPNTSGPG